MTDKKIAPQVQGNQKLSTQHSNSPTDKTQSKPFTRAEIERSLCPSEAHALALSQRENGINRYEADRLGHGSFTARVWDLENKGYVFDKKDVTWINSQGEPYHGVTVYTFIEWRADMFGCKDKDRAQEAIDQSNQLNLFGLESA